MTTPPAPPAPPAPPHAALTPSEQLTHNTVRIECELLNGKTATGTGFFYGFRHNNHDIPLIVTNKHVIKGAKTGYIALTRKSTEDLPLVGQHIKIKLDHCESLWIPHPAADVDLCALPIASLIQQGISAGTPFFHITVDSSILLSAEELADLGAFEDIVMVGYPIGLWDSTNNMPILRRGTTATHPNMDYEGRKEFMIDAACFPGSSGSPVFLFNPNGWATRSGNFVIGRRLKLLGVLYAGPQHTTTGDIVVVNVPTQQQALAVTRIPMNLGFVIKSSRILELQEAVLKVALAKDTKLQE